MACGFVARRTKYCLKFLSLPIRTEILTSRDTWQRLFPKYKKVANALNTLDDYNDIAGEADCFFERGSISEYDYSSLACSYADGKLILRFYGDDIR